MENKKKAKVDYAAIIREVEMYGRGHSCISPLQRKVLTH